MLCSDLVTGHEIREDCDSRDARRDATLKHLLNGTCASVSSPLCRLLARSSVSVVHLSYALCKLLLNAYEDTAIDFITFSLCCTSIGLDVTTTNPPRELVRKLQQWLKCRKALVECEDLTVMLNRLDGFRIESVVALACLHGMEAFSVKGAAHSAIISHLVTGACNHMDGELCRALCSVFQASSGHVKTIDLQLHILEHVLKVTNKKALSCILNTLVIPHLATDSIGMLRSMLRKHRSTLRAASKVKQNGSPELNHEPLTTVANSWPQRISHTEKADIIQGFRSSTSSHMLKSFTCASCAECVRDTKLCSVPSTDIDLAILRRPALFSPDLICHVPPTPFADGVLRGILVDPAGVTCKADGLVFLSLCPPCKSALSHGKLPRFSLANLNVLGSVPPELSELTLIEELIVARCRAKLCVVKLQDHRNDVELPTAQRGIKGHVIVFPQHPEYLSNLMPPALADIVTPICVIFCGSTKPSLQWLKEKAYPLVVRREAVLKALQWLCIHNPLYQDVVIDEARLSALPKEDVLKYNIEHIPLSAASHSLVSRYDTVTEFNGTSSFSQPLLDDRVQFESVVITDVEARFPSHQLKAAALRHTKRGGSFIEVPHDPNPINEFFNPSMFPMLYPTLFPYGIGGFEDKHRTVPIGLENHVQHMLALADKRFQHHYSFMFVIFNVIQRRKVLLHTSLRVNRANFDSWAQRFAFVSIDAINSLLSRGSNGAQPIPTTDDERLVCELMTEVKAISCNIPGSPESRLTMRNEIRANVLSLGVPSFFVTVNPADVYNPVVRFLSGNDIDIDDLLPHQIPTYWEQAKVVARNPCIAAEFFDTYINAFISAVLQYDPKQRSTQSGIFGMTKAYYGCVEAQGRGSLHCHMVVWVHGGLTSDEIRDRATADPRWRNRLIEFLDDTICNVVPADPDPSLSVQSSTYHPCAVRGIDVVTNPASEKTLNARLKDLRNVVVHSQCHSHTATCYKNCRPSGQKRCRFNLDKDNNKPETVFNEATGSLVMRHLDGMVNNYCPTISECLRCNIDTKFMASGDAAKSVLFYVTDYITKTGNKSHVSFGALEVALKRLGDYNPTETDTELRAKKMLQKCVFAVLSHQELSGQQVAAYLKGYGDYYSSHKYRNLYWVAFEKSINDEDPSPECNPIRQSVITESNGAVLTLENIDESVDDDAQSNSSDDIVTEEDLNPLLGGEKEADDVTITTISDGTVIQCSSQVHDYRFRAPALAHLSVWDIISSVDKITDPGSRRHMNDTTPDSQENREQNDGHEDTDDVQDRGDSGENEQLSHSRGVQRGRPSQTFQLAHKHMQNGKKAQRMRSDPSIYYIPVPIGPALPRRDREPLHARYCRLMLILFKPWCVAGDLRNTDETWVNAFDRFVGGCDERIRRILNNMQVMHECKDAKDIEDRQRRNDRRNGSRSGWSDTYEAEELAGGIIEEDLLDHLGSVVNYAADR